MQPPINTDGRHKRLQCCNQCGFSSSNDFKPVVNLRKSGLVVYIHNNDLQQKLNYTDNKGSIILQNSGNKDLKRYDYIKDMCQYKTKCFKCREHLQRIRSLIDSITTINKNAVLAVCEHCKHSPGNNKCKRCEYIVQKFFNNEAKQLLDKEKRLYDCLCSSQQILMAIMQGKIICKHDVVLDTESKQELEKLQKYIQTTIKAHQHRVHSISDINNFRIISRNNDILLKFLTEIDSDKIRSPCSPVSLCKTSNCFCKHLLEGINKTDLNVKFDIHENDFDYESSRKLITQNNIIPSIQDKLKEKNNTDILNEQKPVTMESTVIKKGKYTKIQRVAKQRELQDADKQLILDMIKQRKNELKNNKVRNENKELSAKKIRTENVTTNYLQEKNDVELSSESIFECQNQNQLPNRKMIKGVEIIPKKNYNKELMVEKIPILFDTQVDCSFQYKDNKNVVSNSAEIKKSMDIVKMKNISDPNSRVMLYQLSNREFVDRGWTILPTIKIVRKMDKYKMTPTSFNYSWFYKLQQQKILFYETGEKLAELHEDGCGKWYYKNGCTALDYYNTFGTNSGIRCVIYDLGDFKDLQKKKPATTVACFDYFGNGIVYDSFGNIRLKYNQSEGLVIDRNIGPRCRWKWHTLNDPPVLFPVLLDTFDKEEPRSKNIDKNEKITKYNNEVIAIKLKKFTRDTVTQTRKVFEPFQIRAKVLKINDLFSLRIVSQSNIYLQFRCDRIHFKLNMGMLLKNNEVVGTDISGVSDVSTPFDTMQKPRS